ncbi:hypothetical protein fugu_006757 [Takifugu bimaculatus]|uniref:Sema domain-containing protein n=1 Tax=Takifugu bimaculatus TaxID=433685 RepID=A0A4Z2B317_9TELE|nr:hypothetical protein fugu_006757 [Takifugu bimaculatus]
MVTSDPSVRWVELRGAPLSHLVLDSPSGLLYAGGVDHLYQLTSDLEVMAHARTGPHQDSPDCLPPIFLEDCPSATVTHNYNKLLLVEPGQGSEPGSLIVCGSVYQGICDKRSLTNISQFIYQTHNPVDTQYVAANDPRVSTVALEEELGKLVVGSYSEYNNHFVKALAHGNHAYFLFSRRDMWQKKEYRTYASRLCTSDRSFYSYVEVPLVCRGGYNLAQAAWLGNHTGKPALFVIMAAGQASTPVATSRSALCIYGMAELDAMLLRAQEDSLSEYPCGGEHTPNPIASGVPLQATPTFNSTIQLTAVTTATEAGHTMAFLGDREGYLHKVLVEPDLSGHLYGSLLVDSGSSINADLLLDQSQQHIYVLTNSRLSKVPVSSCERQTDCQSCLAVRDPYCGWCVLEGRCSRKQQCQRHSQPNQWFWSFEATSQCVNVQNLQPASQSRAEQNQVTLSVVQLPVLTEAESLSCVFGLLPPQPAVVTGTSITCQSPVPELLPPMPTGSDHMILPVSLVFGHVTIATSNMTFYDCGAVSRLNQSSQYVQTQQPNADKDVFQVFGVCHQRVEESPGPTSCPLVFGLQSSALVPLGMTTSLVLRGRNLDVYTVQPLSGPLEGGILVTISGSNLGMRYHDVDPQILSLVPDKGPVSGGTQLTIRGQQLLTGQKSDLRAFLGVQSCYSLDEVNDTHLVCQTASSNQTGGVVVRVLFGKAERTIGSMKFRYLDDPVITEASPAESFYAGGRVIMVTGRNLDVVQQPILAVWVEPVEVQRVRRRRRLALLTSRQQLVFNSSLTTVMERCSILSSSQMTCRTPEGQDLTRAISRQEVTARLGNEECEVKTLDNTHLYCEPPEVQPMSVDDGSELPSLKVFMGNLQVDLGLVQYDSDSLLSPVPLAAQIGLAGGAAIIILSVLVIILMYRRKSKQALRDYKKVLVQLETLEINVGDQCRKEFTDLMTEMMDLSSDVGGPGLPLLDYKTYAERVFFPGQHVAPLTRQLDLPESRRQTVEQGLQQLNNLLNNRLFLTRFIHTLEAQQGFSQRDRGYVASLLTMALHDKLEYFTEVMKTLLQDLVQQYVAKNPKLMLRRTETVVEKMLTNWMSICLYSFLKEVAGEPLYMLYRAIKYQVDKGPVDSVTGKAKRTLNDSHLLREDIDYSAMVKDKILDQVYRGAPFSQRPAADSLDLEWRSGQAGHLTLSDDDVTAVVHGRWKRLNTLQHYKVPDGATVALIPRSQSSGGVGVNQRVRKEEGLRLWHLVKSSEDPDIPKHRKSSMRDRERAKAIPEIYLTRLLSMKGTLQKFVDDVFVAILSTKRPPPIAVRFFFDFLDDMAEKHGIDDPETVHIWKTNSLPLRFWVNILKNPQFVLDVQVTDSIDAVLSVIAQTFIDSCTTSEHKVGRDSPVNKLLYAREIPRYKQLVERYYSDIHSAASGCYQEMNSTLTELSGSFASEMNNLVALHELYKYINKYYDQIIMSLDEDSSGQKMQLAYRLQQVAALVENKVTDL